MILLLPNVAGTAYAGLFHPQFVYGTRVLGIENALSDTVEETWAGWSLELGRAKSFLAGYAEQLKEGPNRDASGGINCMAFIEMKASQKGKTFDDVNV